MIKWFVSTNLCIGSSKINQRGVIAGRAYEYPTKAELATANVNVAKAEKTGYIRYMVIPVQTWSMPKYH